MNLTQKIKLDLALYKKQKIEDKFSESKISLIGMRECLKRNPDSDDELTTLDMFLEISTEKITLILK